MTPTTRKKILCLSIVIMAMGAVWAKVRFEAGVSLEKAREFERVRYTKLAIAAYRHTVRWYSPGSGPVKEAVVRLESLGDELLAANKPDLALESYRALRSGIYAIRSTYTPYEEVLPSINHKIATLMAAQEVLSDASITEDLELSDPGSGTKTASDRSSLVAHHEALLSVDHAPNVFWSLVATLGFALWCVSLVMLSQRGFHETSGSLDLGQALRWGTGSLVLLATWASALIFA